MSAAKNGRRPFFVADAKKTTNSSGFAPKTTQNNISFRKTLK
jgi:hypothetical protein